MATLITKNSSTASAVPAAGDLVKGELAVNVTDKKVYTKDNSAAVVKLVGSLGNQEANAVAVTGGAINGTTIGATTPSTGAFTTASASSGFTGNLTGNVTGNVSGTAANVTGVVAIANGGTGLSALGTGVQTALGQNVTGSGGIVLATSPSLTTPNLGTPSAAVLTNATGLPLTTGVTGTLGVANGGTGITAFGTGVATALGQNVTGSGGIVLATSPSLTTPNLGTPSAATLTNATGLPIATGVSGLGTGVATALAVNVGTAGAFVVNGGALGTPSSGTLTNCTGYPTSALSGSINLATQVTGTLGTTNGGTGLTSFTANGVVYASSSSVLTTGSALTFDGTSLSVAIVKRDVDNSFVTLLGGTSSATSAAVYATGPSYAAASTIYIDSAETVFRSLNGVSSRMTLTSTGLGIGTSSPGAKLDVRSGATTFGAQISTSGTNTYTPTASTSLAAANLQILGGNASGACSGMRISHSGNFELFFGAVQESGGAGAFVFQGYSGSVYAERMRLDSSGNLGLGVTPSAWSAAFGPVLQIKTGSGGGAFTGSSTDNFRMFANTYYDGSYKRIGAGYATQYEQASGTHAWYTAGSSTANSAISFTQAMTLTSGGSLLVGTTTQAASSGGRIVSAEATGGGIQIAHNNSGGGALYVALGGGGVATYTYTGAVGSESYTERARIDSSGNLGIGTTSPSAKLHVAGEQLIQPTTAANAKLSMRHGSIGNNNYFEVDISGNTIFGTINAERARITSAGDLLVGTTSTYSSAKMTVESTANIGIVSKQGTAGGYCFLSYALNNGGTYYHASFEEAGTQRGSITSNGSATAYNTSSDYRLKNITGPVTGSGAYIDSLKPVEGTWKADGSAFVGLIAHEAQEVSRTAVATGTKDGEEMQGMDYSNSEFIANIIAELQSLRARVAALESRA